MSRVRPPRPGVRGSSRQGRERQFKLAERLPSGGRCRARRILDLNQSVEEPVAGDSVIRGARNLQHANGRFIDAILVNVIVIALDKHTSFIAVHDDVALDLVTVADD